MLRLRRVPIDFCGDNIVFIHRNNETFKGSTLDSLSKVEIHGGLKPIYGKVVLVDSEDIVKPDELGLSEAGFSNINLPEGSEVSMVPAPPPASINSVQRKIKGGVLSAREYRAIVSDISLQKYSKIEIAALQVANSSFLTPQEVLAMTEAIAEQQPVMKWNRDIVVDEVCLGGVPGNRVSLIVTAIAIGAGMCMPKIARKAVGESSSAIDVMETLCNTDMEESDIRKIVEEIGGCISWCGGKFSVAPIDNILLDVEKSLSIGMPQQMVVSIMSKAISAGVTHLVVDIPVGMNTLVRTMGEAMRLRKLMEYVGDMLGIDVNVAITDGSEPIGRGVGPVLEARDVMNVLRCSDEAPRELREKSLFIAGRILEFDPRLRGGHGYYRAQEILDSGRALEMIKRLIHAQSRNTPMPLGQLTRDITAPVTGVIESIDGNQINRIAIMAGAPGDAGAGIDLLKSVGDEVEQGEPLYRIHAVKSMEFAFANGLAEGNSGFKISNDLSAQYA
ncbi:MAG: thymidine phosphorylase [Alphaproteobacteria bacterium]|nr:thymidine phosphorylase [Alphaproteobacteria bacterium]